MAAASWPLRKSAVAICVVLFSAPFILLAGAYAALPPELPVFRNHIAGAVMVAPKSAFMTFRVPLMNLTHGLMAAVMLAHTPDFEDGRRRRSYFAFISTLLFAIALKSNFEALEILSAGRWATGGTLVSVVGGLILAFVRGRGVPLPWPELRLSVRDKIILAVLLVTYLAIVAASLLSAHQI